MNAPVAPEPVPASPNAIDCHGAATADRSSTTTDAPAAQGEEPSTRGSNAATGGMIAACQGCARPIEAAALLCPACGFSNLRDPQRLFKIDPQRLTLSETWRILARLFTMNRSYWRFQLLLMGLSGAIFLLFLPGPYLSKLLVDDVVKTGNRGLVHLILLVNLAICLLMFVVSLLHSYISLYVGSRIERDLQTDLFTRFQRLPMPFYERMPTGEIIYSATTALDQVKEFLLYRFGSIISNLIFVGLAALVLLSINLKLGLISLVCLPLWAVVAQAFNRWQAPIESEAQTKVAEVYSLYGKNLTHVGLIKSYAMESHERRRFFEVITGVLEMSVRRILLSTLSGSVLLKLTMVSSALLMWVGGLAILNGELSVGDMFAFTAFLGYLWSPTEELLVALSAISPYMLASLRVFAIIDAEAVSGRRDGDLELPQIDGSIEFHQVSFAYTPGHPIVRDLNLQIQPGEKVALVGASGSGKTTVLKLLLRFYEIDQGAIFIDGFDIKDLRVDSLRQKVGVVMQQQFVLPGTVAENIRYGRPEASDEEVIEAARNANAHEFILQLPDGYQTKIGGDGGHALSGGEAQRIAIARVILKKARILVLDEATSALDNQTEVLIQGAMDYLMRDRTCIVVAHRLSTIEDADRICVFDQGRIVQTGTHAQLLAESGPYSDLHQRRIKGEDA